VEYGGSVGVPLLVNVAGRIAINVAKLSNHEGVIGKIGLSLSDLQSSVMCTGTAGNISP